MDILLRFGNFFSKSGGHIGGVQGRAEGIIKNIIKNKSE
jgi:hypothetical protein